MYKYYDLLVIKGMSDQSREYNFVKFETSQNLPSVLKIVTRTAYVA